MKANRVRKLIMSLMLSAALIAEPIAGTVVYAEEPEMTQETSAEKETEEKDTSEDKKEQPDESGQKQDNPDTSDDKEGENSGELTEESDVESEKNSDEQTEESAEEEGTLEGEESAEGEETVEENPKEAEDEKAQETVEGISELMGFAEMPSTYHLTSAQKEEKSVLADNIGNICEEDEGELYVAKQVMTAAESKEEAEQIAEAYHAEIVAYENGILLMKLGEETSVCDAVAAAASAKTNLPAVWPNYYRYAHEEDDELLEIEESEYELEESELNVTDVYAQAAAADPNLNPMEGNNYQWQHVAVGSPYAWAEGYTGQGVKVAVLDSGVSPHEDLVMAGNNTVYSGGNTEDKAGHGTHVAGIIGAQRNNGKGGAGIAPDASLYNIRVLDDNGSGEDYYIIQGIKKAMDYDVDLINMSLGGPGYNALFEEAVEDAYEKGIAVFVSAGNDGISVINYPAGYDHVICVAATDNGNGRADFSTYGSWVDLSAPGAYIYSTYNGSSSNYTIASGTSMACPVATGEAAVILSSDIISSEKGPGRVDELERVMKKNTIKVNGSGMGVGITSLTKVFNLSTAAMKPGAPSINMTLAEDKQSVGITIQAQGGMKLYYTTNGKNPVYKDGVADENTQLYTTPFSLDCSQTAKGTVKAIAVNESGVISSVKSQSYTLAPYVTGITVTGPAKVEKGKSISLAATVTPSYATNKKVTWALQTKDGAEVDTTKIRIDSKSGKVTTTANTDLGIYKVVVTAQDTNHQQTTYLIQVVETGATVQRIAFDNNVNKELWITEETPNPTRDLQTSLIAEEKSEDESYVKIETKDLSDRIIWTSSNTNIASVDVSTGKVTAKAAGTVTITAKANDNVGKKASLKLTVKQAVTGITITTDKGNTESQYFKVVAGKTMSLKAKIEPVKPTNNKIIWSVNSIDDKVTINPTTGKLTVKAGAVSADYTITATAADGQGAEATKNIKVCSGVINQISLKETKATLYTTNVGEGKSTQAEVTATIKGTDGFDPDAYTVTSSNESIVRVSQKRKDDTVTITITATGNMYGKANVVIASTDGSNKKASCAVTVNGGITKAEIKSADQTKLVSSLTLFRAGTKVTSAPSTATLYAVMTGSEGANIKAYTVESSNPNLVKASVDTNTGKITLTASDKSTGKAKITLTATDGSKKKATCNVTVVNPVSKINIASKTITAWGGNSYNMAVVSGKSLQLCATLETEYGTVSNKGVAWSINADKDSGVSISSSGKISAKKGKSIGKFFTVTATAKDGSGVYATYKVKVVEPASYVWLIDGEGNRLPLYGYSKGKKVMYIYRTYVLPDEDGVQQFYSLRIGSDIEGGYVTATSSNSKIMEVRAYNGYMLYTPRKPGNVSVTLQATDGSGIKTVYKFKVLK